MKTGRRTVLMGMMGVVVGGILPALPARSDDGLLAAGVTPALRLDFGGTAPAPATGYYRVLTSHNTGNISATRPWGWLAGTGLPGLAARDRNTPTAYPLVDNVFRDFIFASAGAGRVFRIINLPHGRYRVTFQTGDRDFGDHTTKFIVPGLDGNEPLPVLKPGPGEYATLTATFVIPQGSSSVDFKFETTEKNWIISGLILEPVTNAERARATVDIFPPASKWGPILTSEDPTAPLLAGHRSRVAASSQQGFKPTYLARPDYLALIAGEVDFWKTQQNATGAIIDPYLNREFQYSTPAYAHAAATLVAYAGRADLLESAALALDWSARTLSTRRAANGHEDFFAPMIAHAIRLLKPFVPAERSAMWEYDIWFFEPFLVYRFETGVSNWNVVAASGEALFQMMGIRDADHHFVEASFAKQGAHFDSRYGLYLEGPMAYDHFPRLWIGDLVARGYNGPYAQELNETLRRGAITSLFMQSPVGELPAGGRSAHHQWNEAQQCVTFEIYSARALAAGDMELAAYFKRAAHLSLSSMRRWVRPSGEMQIVKNWVDPSQNHGYETYSAHSQYNLLPMSMLAIAYEHAETTEGIAELPAPADTGGYVLEIDELHKVFANSGGAYVELDTKGDHAYDATGLIRVHFSGHSPQLGTSDSVLAKPKYLPTAGAPNTTGVGVSWLGEDGTWRFHGELLASQVSSVSILTEETTAERVTFSVRYEGTMGGGVTAIVERFVLTPDSVEVTTSLPGYTGPVRRIVPLLADDGRTKCKVQVNGDEAMFWQQGEFGTSKQTFQAVGASKVTIGTERYANHNGWVNLAVGEYPAGAGEAGVTLIIGTQGDRSL